MARALSVKEEIHIFISAPDPDHKSDPLTLDSSTGIAVLVWIVSAISTDQYYPDVRMRKVI